MSAPPKRLRRVVQFKYDADSHNYYHMLCVLCDDGTIWRKTLKDSEMPRSWELGWENVDLTDVETTELP